MRDLSHEVKWIEDCAPRQGVRYYFVEPVCYAEDVCFLGTQRRWSPIDIQLFHGQWRCETIPHSFMDFDDITRNRHAIVVTLNAACPFAAASRLENRDRCLGVHLPTRIGAPDLLLVDANVVADIPPSDRQPFSIKVRVELFSYQHRLDDYGLDVRNRPKLCRELAKPWSSLNITSHELHGRDLFDHLVSLQPHPLQHEEDRYRILLPNIGAKHATEDEAANAATSDHAILGYCSPPEQEYLCLPRDPEDRLLLGFLKGTYLLSPGLMRRIEPFLNPSFFKITPM